jgi:hypothetical protein
MKSVLAWHFVWKTLRDGRAIPKDYVTLVHEGELVMCKSGLHASRRLIDALLYATGNTVCRVRCSGKIIEDKDKLVCSDRKILWRINASNLLRQFARKQALTVGHLWDMPDVVRRYLETGDESIRAAAHAAAHAAARAATRDAAACDAARTAAGNMLTKMAMDYRKSLRHENRHFTHNKQDQRTGGPR